jgi:predicted phage tail protein
MRTNKYIYHLHATMDTAPEALFLRPVTGGFLLGLLGAVVFPFAVSALWRATGLTALGLSGVATFLSLAAMGTSLVICWQAMSYREEHERIQMLLDQIDRADE